jgi:hypothetical protein
MKRARKLLLAFLILFLLLQVPFAYRRYKLRQLSISIRSINSTHVSPANEGFVDYQGVIHVHSFLGGHSSGTFQEIISAAQANQLQFVIMTEHAEKEIDTAAMTLQGVHSGVLFVTGNEVSSASGDRLLLIPGDSSSSLADKKSTSEIASQARARNALAIVAYPDEFKSSENVFDGIEVYNLFTNARSYNRFLAFFDTLWSYSSYSDLLFANFHQRPSAALRRWDSMSAQKRVVATAGNDAHSNVGVSLNDSNGNRLIGIKLDPYSTSFHLVRMHLLLAKETPLDTNSLLKALRAGHCYVGFDLFGDASGFRFSATNGSTVAIQGDEIPLQPETRLKVTVPVTARVTILKDGQTLVDVTGVREKEVQVTERGVYRVEVYLPQLAKPVGEQPWIISNPIYVK